jgi:uncharacterized C2H2 Zn-finger protein
MLSRDNQDYIARISYNCLRREDHWRKERRTSSSSSVTPNQYNFNSSLTPNIPYTYPLPSFQSDGSAINNLNATTKLNTLIPEPIPPDLTLDLRSDLLVASHYATDSFVPPAVSCDSGWVDFGIRTDGPQDPEWDCSLRQLSFLEESFLHPAFEAIAVDDDVSGAVNTAESFGVEGRSDPRVNVLTRMTKHPIQTEQYTAIVPNHIPHSRIDHEDRLDGNMEHQYNCCLEDKFSPSDMGLVFADDQGMTMDPRTGVEGQIHDRSRIGMDARSYTESASEVSWFHCSVASNTIMNGTNENEALCRAQVTNAPLGGRLRRCDSVLGARDAGEHSSSVLRGSSSKPFVCEKSSCKRGFTYHFDLLRHRRTVHRDERMGYRCTVLGCPKADKLWIRHDSYKKHVRNCHGGADFISLYNTEMMEQKNGDVGCTK